MRRILLIILLTALAFADASAQNPMPLVYDAENTASDYPDPNFPSFSDLPVIQPFPDPFAWSDGRGRMSNLSDWRYRRAEIGAGIQHYEIGKKPGRPDSITAGYAAGVLTVNVTVNGNTLTLTSNVILPAGTGPFPAVIGMNSPSGSIPSTIFSSRNIAQITYSHNQVTTYNSPSNLDPYYELYGPELNIDSTGQYSAWAWGVSRIIDGLELVQGVLPIDLAHIAVTGCSYAGKMALFAGAFDERIALTIAQESGGGGATSWRYSQTEPSGSVETIGGTSHQWFSEVLFQFAGSNVSKLPVDHHELCAMVAPRALLVTGNPDYTWLSNPSCYVNSRGVEPVYNALGVSDRFGYSIIGGHLHCAVPGSQIPEVEAFVEKFLLGNDTVNTHVATTPYDIDPSPWITWTTPTLSNDSSLVYWTSLRHPADRQIGLDTTVEFRWKRVQDAVQYIVQVSLDQGFATIEKSDSTADTSKTLSGLLTGKQYYWRVKVQTVAGVDLWSNVWGFITTATPSKPQGLGATPVPGQSGYATYFWDRVPAAGQYSIRVSIGPPLNRSFRTDTTPDTSITFSGHAEGQEYLWQVQANNVAGTGPWSDTTSFTFSTTGVDEKNGVPGAYSLHQNFPNPFNPSTQIEYTVGGMRDEGLEVSLVRLGVYDVLGREVAVLVNKPEVPGSYSVQWNAADMPSGVYFYTIRSGGYVDTKKMVLMR